MPVGEAQQPGGWSARYHAIAGIVYPEPAGPGPTRANAATWRSNVTFRCSHWPLSGGTRRHLVGWETGPVWRRPVPRRLHQAVTHGGTGTGARGE